MGDRTLCVDKGVQYNAQVLQVSEDKSRYVFTALFTSFFFLPHCFLMKIRPLVRARARGMKERADHLPSSSIACTLPCLSIILSSFPSFLSSFLCHSPCSFRGKRYFIHFMGWNKNHDKWVPASDLEVVQKLIFTTKLANAAASAVAKLECKTMEIFWRKHHGERKNCEFCAH